MTQLLVTDMDKMRKNLIQDEGIVLSAYKDHLGYLTIGCGHLIDKAKGGKISMNAAMFILNEDINDRIAAIKDKSWFKACDTDARRRALINMSFQLGVEGLEKFKNSLALIEQQKWKEAGAALRKSLWYEQTKVRAERTISRIETGVD